jgi:hypothetical protein
MSCLLSVYGESFEPTSVPELLALRPYSVHRKGDKMSGGLGFYEVGGMSFEVSPRERPVDLIEDAVAYLARHHDLLKKVANLDAIRYRSLSFLIFSEQSETCHLSMTLPALLMRLAADLDLDVNCSFTVLEVGQAIQYPPYRK